MDSTKQFPKQTALHSIVAPPPSAETQKGGTNLDAALSHLRPSIERLLPRARQDKKSDAGKFARKTER